MMTSENPYESPVVSVEPAKVEPSKNDGDGKKNAVNGAFEKLARHVSSAVGSPIAFGVAFMFIIVWGALGPLFHFTDAWQLVVNTGTTIVTFLMVFLIQSAQNRDSTAIHLKLDELIRANNEARNGVMAAAELSSGELAKLKAEFAQLSKQTQQIHSRISDYGTGNELKK